MRAATLLKFLVGATAGCSAGVAEQAERAASDSPNAVPVAAPEAEIWDVFKVELPGRDGIVSFAVEGVIIRARGDVVTVTESGVFDHTHHCSLWGSTAATAMHPTSPRAARLRPARRAGTATRTSR